MVRLTGNPENTKNHEGLKHHWERIPRNSRVSEGCRDEREEDLVSLSSMRCTEVSLFLHAYQ
uniref:Uncharacterized protein n=1 Tax=Cucumis melo TaxID=3656 RepID=A0A9I9EBN5_CUCME